MTIGGGFLLADRSSRLGCFSSTFGPERCGTPGPAGWVWRALQLTTPFLPQGLPPDACGDVGASLPLRELREGRFGIRWESVEDHLQTIASPGDNPLTGLEKILLLQGIIGDPVAATLVIEQELPVANHPERADLLGVHQAVS